MKVDDDDDDGDHPVMHEQRENWVWRICCLIYDFNLNLPPFNFIAMRGKERDSNSNLNESNSNK